MPRVVKCPNYKEGQPGHDKFFVDVYLAQAWEVNGRGDYLDIAADSKPDFGEVWTCTTCDEEIDVTEEKEEEGE